MEIDKSELMDGIEEIQAKVDRLGFIGSNENDLWRREFIADYIIKKMNVIQCCVTSDSRKTKAIEKYIEQRKEAINNEAGSLKTSRERNIFNDGYSLGYKRGQREVK